MTCGKSRAKACSPMPWPTSRPFMRRSVCRELDRSGPHPRGQMALSSGKEDGAPSQKKRPCKARLLQGDLLQGTKVRAKRKPRQHRGALLVQGVGAKRVGAVQTATKEAVVLPNRRAAKRLGKTLTSTSSGSTFFEKHVSCQTSNLMYTRSRSEMSCSSASSSSIRIPAKVARYTPLRPRCVRE